MEAYVRGMVALAGKLKVSALMVAPKKRSFFSKALLSY